MDDVCGVDKMTGGVVVTWTEDASYFYSYDLLCELRSKAVQLQTPSGVDDIGIQDNPDEVADIDS